MDSFSTYPNTLTAPARDAAAVVPDDLTDLPQTSRALYVGLTGDLAVLTAGGQTVTFPAVQGGSLLPLRVDRVLATGTTAGGLVALW